MPVNLVDPIKYLTPYEDGAVDLEKLFLYVDLKVIKRSASIITEGSDIRNTSKGDVALIGLMGYDLETNEYTTSYTETLDPKYKSFEGFGISKINIRVNSSYVPVVDIEFIDVKGASLFNYGEGSPYSVLFDFPPPIYTLRVKGFYGGVVEYELHLKESSIAFDSSTGNRTIRVKFVGRTFAPLTDVLLKYIEYFPMMVSSSDQTNSYEISLESSSPPKTYAELLKRCRMLYNDVSNTQNNSELNRKLQEVNIKREKVSETLNYINSFKERIDTSLYESAYFAKVDDQPQVYPSSGLTVGASISYLKLRSITDYSRLVLSDDKTQKLMIIIETNPSTKEQVFETMKKIRDDIFSELQYTQVIPISTSTYPLSIVYNNTETPTFYSMDLTPLYKILYKLQTTVKANYDEIRKKMISEVNETTYDTLGMKPTIRNVFKLICDDVDIFFRKLYTVGIDAQDHHNRYYSTITGYFNNISPNVKRVFPFPLYIENDPKTKSQVKSFIGNKIPTPSPFPEAILVEDFIEASVKQVLENKAITIKDVDESGNNKWVPVNPLDSDLFMSSPLTPYDISNVGDNIQAIYSKLAERFVVADQYTYKNFFNDELIRKIAYFEATNIANSVKNSTTRHKLILDADNSKNSGYQAVIDNYLSQQKYSGIQIGDKILTPDKTSSNFAGLSILEDTANLVEDKTDDGNNNVDLILKSEFDKNYLSKLMKLFGVNTNTVGLTKQNLIKVDPYNAKYEYLTKDYGYDIAFKSLIKGSLSTKSLLGFRTVFTPFYNFLINDDIADEVKAYFILGLIELDDKPFLNMRVVTPFNNERFKQDIKVPGILDIPFYSLLTAGAEIYLTENHNNYNNYVNDGYGYGIFDSDGYLKNIDRNLITNLSENDKNIYLNTFEDFLTNDYPYLISAIIETGGLYYKISGMTDNTQIDTIIDDFIQSDNTINHVLKQKKYLVNSTTTTFDPIETGLLFNSEVIFGPKGKIFFDAFYSRLKNVLITENKEFESKKAQYSTSLDNDDIKNQIYSSFKTIYDRWVAGNPNIGNGFPLSDGRPLIDMFSFVDRAFNDIGDDAIINIKGLIELSDEPDVSVFQAFGKLLTDNGWEFFPLPNFVNYGNIGNFEKVFGINESVDVNITPNFVCMYIGGSSTILDISNAPYLNDSGKLDMDIPEDLSASEAQINAFKITYAKQNQSIFKDIVLDTIEHDQTNESLIILSDLSGDNSKSSPVPIGQNLYNIYEQRSYTAKINMLMNAMITPMLYFQLENIPMFDGAYMILNVEHTIGSNNYGETKIEGMRIAKWRTPIVTSYAATIGYDTQTTEDLSSIIDPFDMSEFRITNAMNTLTIDTPTDDL